MWRIRSWAFLGLLLLAGSLSGAGDPPGLRNPVQEFQNAWFVENVDRDLVQAITLYQQVAEASERGGLRVLSARAWVRIGLCHERLGAMDEAQKAYRKALRFSSEQPIDQPELLEKLERVGSLVIVVNDFPTPVQKQILDYFYTMAEQIQRTDPESAIGIFRHVVKLSNFLGQTTRAIYAESFIGDLYRATGRYEDALKTYGEVLRQYPEETDARAWVHIKRAETCRLLGKPDEAIRAYQSLQSPEFERQSKHRLWAELWMGDAFRDGGELARAREVWATMVRPEPEPPLPCQLAAMLLGKQDMAMPDNSEDPFSNDVAYFVGIRYSMAGELDKARECYEKCIRLSQGLDWPRQLAMKVISGSP